MFLGFTLVLKGRSRGGILETDKDRVRDTDGLGCTHREEREKKERKRQTERQKETETCEREGGSGTEKERREIKETVSSSGGRERQTDPRSQTDRQTEQLRQTDGETDDQERAGSITSLGPVSAERLPGAPELDPHLWHRPLGPGDCICSPDLLAHTQAWEGRGGGWIGLLSIQSHPLLQLENWMKKEKLA